ncbi:MAG: ATP-binding protein [Chrysiogenales bacterium]|nr:MAG: ATP-binding protein [Chrysiogenales bacterium]
MSDEEMLISYDRMKEQVEKELLPFFERNDAGHLAPPVVSFEKGSTRISFGSRPMTSGMMADFLLAIKKHLSNIRIHSFEDGYYAFQAMNRNLFKPEGMLDNFKVEFFVLSASSKVEISKKGNLTQEEISLAIELFRMARASSGQDPEDRLRMLGSSIVEPDKGLDWDYIAGYEEVKRKIRESIILPLKNPAVYDSIARMTRKVFESNRPRAILFDGAPGVGKTTAARVIAGEAEIPLVYVPVESIMSKWYGQSSQNLSQIFDACEEMGGAIIFLDEIDSLAGSRDNNMFEATRQVLSVLLRRLDGIGAAASTITIGATNRKDDLDHALISRFDQTIYFPLPNAAERAAIFSNYAKHLDGVEHASLGDGSEGLSGRNIKDICEFAERRWARKTLIKKLKPSVPPFEFYKQTLRIWKETK